MAEPIESTELWDIYQLPDGRKINILRSEVSVALAAARFQFCPRSAQLPQAQGTVPPEHVAERSPIDSVVGDLGRGRANGQK